MKSAFNRAILPYIVTRFCAIFFYFWVHFKPHHWFKTILTSFWNPSIHSLFANWNQNKNHLIAGYDKTSDTHLLYCQYLSWAAFLGQSQAKPFEPICQVAVVAISPFSPSLPKAEPWEISAFVLLMVNTFLAVFQKKLFSQGHTETNHSNWTNLNIFQIFLLFQIGKERAVTVEYFWITVRLSVGFQTKSSKVIQPIFQFQFLSSWDGWINGWR